MKSAELSKEEIQELQEIFNLVDTDGGGSISNEELRELMQTLGINATQEEVDNMVREIDQDANGEIDFDEFVAVMSRKVKSYTKEEALEAFEYFERDEHLTVNRPELTFEDGGNIQRNEVTGKISVDKLKNILKQYSSKSIEEAKLNQIMNRLELDDDGFFDYKEYLEIILNQ
eukprot:snap_masked-scaffold_29-processed-gene-3.0-mRNA-1 protein AED:0.03 eAED:0.05 QI:0/-1/0/1/-1/1/1/0/172